MPTTPIPFEDSASDDEVKTIFRSELFSFLNKYIYLFSKSRFSSYCLEYAKNNPSVHLITFEDIIKAYELNKS